MTKHYTAKTVAYDQLGNQHAPANQQTQTGLTIEQVARLTLTDQDESLWAIEEYGHFEAMVDNDSSQDWLVTEEA
jgi:hypothetical protein